VSWQPFFWSAFRQSRNPMALVDERRRYVDVNDATVELLGRTRDELGAMRLDDVVPEANRPRLAARWDALIAYGAPLTAEGEVLCSDGGEVEVELAAHPAEVSGRLLALIVVIHVEAAMHADRGDAAPDAPLTPREREVVDLLALGRSGPEIAEELVISHDTVRTHVRNAMDKTGSHTRAQLVARTLAGVAPR
jgi:PAS domain S-box-containing protein